MIGLKGRLRRIRTAGSIAGFTATAIVVATIPGIALTNASWNDQEFVHGTLGAEDCSTATNFSTRAAGKLISGSIGALNLDTLASVNGVVATNDSTGSHVFPAGATSLGTDAYANPLSVTALGTINASLGSLLQLPLNTDAGALNQYAQAHSNGSSTGASGVVNNSGGIALTTTTPTASVPTFATVDLSTLLATLGLGGVGNLANLQLKLGAVASSAQLDACSALWNQDVAANVHRNYEIAGLTTAFTSPLVGQLTSTVTTADTTLANAVNGVAGNSGVANAALTGLTSTLGPLLTALGLGTPTASVSATVDLSSVNSILTGDITDSGHIVDINLGAGTITINTAALFDSAHGLNNQAPNTQLLINSTVINALKTAVTSALNNYITSVNNAVRAALAAVKVNVSVVLPLAGFGTGGGVTIAATNVSLASLIAGTATLNATVTCTADALTCVASHAILDPLLSGVVTTVQGLIETPLGNAIAGLLSPTVTTLISNLNTVSSGIVTLLGTVLSGLFGPTSVLSLVVNAQNAPVPALSGHPLPIWAASQPAPSTTPFKTGRYGVSAIELVVAGAISVDLGHSSVGSNDLTP